MSVTAETQMAKQITSRIGDDLERRLELYLESDEHVWEPNQSDVVRKALDEFLPTLEELEQQGSADE